MSCYRQLVQNNLGENNQFRYMPSRVDNAYSIYTKYCLCLIMVKSQPQMDAIGFNNLTLVNVSPYLNDEPSALCTSGLGPWMIVLFFVGGKITASSFVLILCASDSC